MVLLACALSFYPSLNQRQEDVTANRSQMVRSRSASSSLDTSTSTSTTARRILPSIPLPPPSRLSLADSGTGSATQSTVLRQEEMDDDETLARLFSDSYLHAVKETKERRKENVKIMKENQKLQKENGEMFEMIKELTLQNAQKQKQLDDKTRETVRLKRAYEAEKEKVIAFKKKQHDIYAIALHLKKNFKDTTPNQAQKSLEEIGKHSSSHEHLHVPRFRNEQRASDGDIDSDSSSLSTESEVPRPVQRVESDQEYCSPKEETTRAATKC